MKKVPVAFCFDRKLDLPASVCIFSLLSNAGRDTFYDIYILRPESEECEVPELDSLQGLFDNFEVHYRKVDDRFRNAYEVRGITNITYYRLLIPELIPEYDKIIYSDVDVIFRSDISSVFEETSLTDDYISGVNSLSHLNHDRRRYYVRLNLDPSKVIYAGNMIINSEKIRRDNLVPSFMSLVDRQYQFQDLDILNLVCAGHIRQMSPSFCVTSDFSELAACDRGALLDVWTEAEIDDALQSGIIHYNGQKPWNGPCINFDIWWEYYRKSPFFDRRFYFDFFNDRLNEYDLLPLWKRVKILVRYFVYGRQKYMVTQNR